jgi:Transport and Golgi organisation 2
MCTVTFIARRNGYALGMNRDEKLTRAQALPPARHRLDRCEALFPSEPTGGTWIGVNDSGATFALINWYSVAARVAGQCVSRGEVVKFALPCTSCDLTDKALASFPLARANPFRLIGIFPARQLVVEWRWNLYRLECLAHRWRTHTWISSGFDEPGAQQTRSTMFRRATRQTSYGSLDWLRRLHRSHAPNPGPYSHCMHRADAATVSYTQITVSPGTATMRYIPGAPCCAGATSTAALTLPTDNGFLCSPASTRSLNSGVA